MCRHSNADGSAFDAVGGAQMLDAWFGAAKKDARCIRRDYSSALDESLSSSQGRHWIGPVDRWAEAAKVLRYMDGKLGGQ